MNLYHLYYFKTLAGLEHYTKAAEELAITQPSLSHAIANLEDELGVYLFEKKGRNVKLTRDGKIFLDYVDNSLEILEAGIKRMTDSKMGYGTVDIGVLRSMGTTLLPSIIKDFLKQNPNLDINFNISTDTGMSQDIIRGLMTRKYEIVFCSKILEHKDIYFIPVARQELVLIVPENHPLSEFDEVDLIDTLEYPYIAFRKNSGLYGIINNLYEKLGKKPQNISYKVEEDQVAAGLVSAGFGISVVPDMNLLDTLKLKKIKIKSPKWDRLLYVGILKDSKLTMATKKFYEFIIDQGNLYEF